MCPSDTSIEIKKVTTVDWEFIRDLCVRTGDSVDPSRAPFFSELWIGPYQNLKPEWSYVTWIKGERVGYLTAAPDTQKFKTERWFKFYLPLFFKVFLKYFIWNNDSKKFIKKFLKQEAWVEDYFSKKTRTEIKKRYPAHLHMNVEEKCRGTGVGRALVDRLRTDLKTQGIHGIHLYCGQPPLAFYERLGFQIIEKVEIKLGVFVYALGS